ncbi:hypothetical protein E1J06_02875 [Phocaeicola dorei]|uniref:Uncharacterized protein n=1 Tax=Phocaeicola dorei TaxID=357276 RepID=A0AAX2QZZ3_9BACT|nr:hypothetical protein E1J06_02875 [Phocaeicola dorei]
MDLDKAIKWHISGKKKRISKKDINVGCCLMYKGSCPLVMEMQPLWIRNANKQNGVVSALECGITVWMNDAFTLSNVMGRLNIMVTRNYAFMTIDPDPGYWYLGITK